MGLYSSGSGRHGGGLYSQPPAAPAGAPKQQHHGGLLHDIGQVVAPVGNLLSDVKDTALSIPAGTVNLVEHPVRGAKAVLKGEWHDWSPLFHGHVGEWAHNTYAHPLAPLLDVAAVAGLVAAPFTGGASLALDTGDAAFQDANLLSKVAQATQAAKLVRAAPSLGKVAVDQTTGKARLLAEGDTAAAAKPVVSLPAMSKDLRRAPLARVRQVALHTLANKTEPYLPQWFGSDARWVRSFNKDVGRRSVALHNQLDEQVAHHAQIAQFVDAGQKLAVGAPELRNKIIGDNYAQIRHFAHSVPDPGAAPRWRTDANGAKVLNPKPLKFKPPKGFSYVKELAPKDLASTSSDHASFVNELRNMGNKFTTQDYKEAARHGDGGLLLVPKHTLRNLGHEAADSAEFLHKLVTSPARLWKTLQVGFTPKMVVNNSVGNVFMTMMEHDPVNLTKGALDAFRQTRNSKAIHGLADGLNSYAPNAVDKHFKDVLSSPSTAEGLISKDGGIKGIAKRGLYPLIHKQEQALKRVSINSSLRQAPEVRQFMSQGLSFNDAADRALQNRVFRDSVAKRAFDTMGDYRTFSKSEKAIRDFIPFYSWDKHIALHTASMLDEHPAKLAMLAGTGHEGSAETKKLLGALPTYAEGLLPLSMLGIHQKPGQTEGVLGVRGLNPYSTVGDLAGLVQSLSVGGTPNPGEDLTGQLNPFITSAIEHIAGHRLGTQVPVSNKGGFLLNVLKDPLANTPEYKIPKTLIEGTPQPKPNKRTGKVTPFLYSKDPKTLISSLLGVPLKQINLERAHELAKKQGLAGATTAVSSRRRQRKATGIYG